MSTFKNIIRASAATTFLFFGAVHAEEGSQTSKAQVSPKEAAELQQKISEAAKEINELPDVKKLKESVELAQKAYTEAFEKEMAKKDPELLEKYKQMREARMEQMRQPRPEKAQSQPAGYDSLSEAERKKLFDVRKQAMDSPAVKDARQKRNTAKTEAERKAAEQEYKAALRNAMLSADKDLVGLLDKLEGKKSEKAAAPTATPDKK